MNYKKSFASVFNPIWVIGFQSVLALLLVVGKPSSTPAYIAFVLLPAIVYILYALSWRYAGKLSGISPNSVFGPLIWSASVGLVALVCVGNILLVVQLVEMYGGIDSTINNFGRTEFIIDVQYNAPKQINYLIALNYIMPVAVVPLVLRSGIRFSLIILVVPIVLLFIASNLYGARILFLDTLISIGLTVALLFPLRLKLLVGLVVSGMLLLIGVAGLQAARYGDNIGRGFEEMGKYYSVSLNHGAIIISQDRIGQPMYWTLRSTFSIPFLSNALGTEAVYEGIFGEIPIKSREDDFAYAARLGVDPRYNTFSMYGYSFLDLGMWGMFIVFFSYIFLHYLYSLYISYKPLGVLLYPALYALLLDQLRTNSIFSTRSIYFLLTAGLLMTIHVASRKTKGGLNGTAPMMGKL